MTKINVNALIIQIGLNWFGKCKRGSRLKNWPHTQGLKKRRQQNAEGEAGNGNG